MSAKSAPVPRDGNGAHRDQGATLSTQLDPRIASKGYTLGIAAPSDVATGLSIIGKRGARYALWRNVPNPDRYFAVSETGRCVRVAGFNWFTVRDGMLVGLR